MKQQDDLTYGLRITNQGKSVFGNLVDSNEFLVPAYKSHPLHEAIQQCLKENAPCLWSSRNSLVTAAIFPCHATLSDLYSWMTPEGQKWLIDDIGEHECCWESEDAFTLMLNLHAGSFFKQQNQDQGDSWLTFTFHTTRTLLDGICSGNCLRLITVRSKLNRLLLRLSNILLQSPFGSLVIEGSVPSEAEHDTIKQAHSKKPYLCQTNLMR